MVSDCHVGHYNPTTENGAKFPNSSYKISSAVA